MKILMVCLGNICRSPLAEGILQHKISNAHQVDSAGTSAYHIGNPPDKRSILQAKKHGIDISQQKARQFVAKDFDAFDLIYVMDQSNYANVLLLANNQAQRNKVDLILNELNPNQNQKVPDPYYGGQDGFEQVFELLDAATDAIVKKYQLN